MKSKISFFNRFFNKTIFWKNVTLYWPIWGIYTLAVFINLPIMSWITNHMGNFYGEYTKEQRLSDLLVLLDFERIVVIIAIAVIVTGMALYSYLYNSKSANMIHSLPVDRTQLYGTTLISGWAFLIVPLFVATLFTTLLCWSYGVPGVEYVWIWFLVTSGTVFAAFGIVSLCALFTGHIVVLPMFIIAVNYISWIVYYMIQIVVTTFGYGVSDLSDRARQIAEFFSPLQCFYNNLSWKSNVWTMETGKGLEGIEVSFQGAEAVIFYTIFAMICYAVAYIIYRKRKIEYAGDFLTVSWVKPIFRVAIGCVGGIFGAMLIRSLLIEMHIGCETIVFVVFMLVIGALFYFAADMFIKKSFHVFKKRDWMRCGIFSVVLVAIFGGLYGVAENYENYIPKREQIEKAELSLGYEIELTEDEIDVGIGIHEDILEQRELLEDINRSMVECQSIRIDYYLNNGERITRRYYIPTEMESLRPSLELINEMEKDPENFLKYTFGEHYQDIELFYNAYINASFVNPEYRGDDEKLHAHSNYDNIMLEPEQAKELFEAVVADIKAGTLMKYNVYSGSKILSEAYGDVYYKSTEAGINFEYQRPVSEEKEESDDMIYTEDGYVSSDSIVYEHNWGAYVNFGPDCVNTVNKLIELGIIESVEDIWWGEAEELLK